MKVEDFINKEQDLIILLLCLTGVKLKVQLTDEINQARLRITSLDLQEQEIEEISIYDKDLEMINDRLNAIGYEFSHLVNDRAVFRNAASINKIHEHEVGDLVKLLAPFGNTPAGCLCFVYEAYNSGKKNGISLISEDGNNLGTFTVNQQIKFLEHLAYTGYHYNFRNAYQLKNDFENGYFNKAFEWDSKK